MRPPAVSIFLFLSAFLFIGYGFVEVRILSNTRLSISSNTQHDRRAQRITKFTEVWQKQPNYMTTFNALAPNHQLTAGVHTLSAKHNPLDDYFGLPEGDGRELVFTYCSACHSLEIVMQQSASPERWTYLLTWMVETQNMPLLDAENEHIIIEYLSTNFGPGNPD